VYISYISDERRGAGTKQSERHGWSECLKAAGALAGRPFGLPVRVAPYRVSPSSRCLPMDGGPGSARSAAGGVTAQRRSYQLFTKAWRNSDRQRHDHMKRQQAQTRHCRKRGDSLSAFCPVAHDCRLNLLPLSMIVAEDKLYFCSGPKPARLRLERYQQRAFAMRIPAFSLLLLSLALPALADDGAPMANSGAGTNVDNSTMPTLSAHAIYLMGRVQMNGTELDRAVFWQDHSVTSVEQCDKLRIEGLATGWRAYHPYVRSTAGMSYRVDYRCVESAERMTAYRPGIPFENFYLIRSGGNELHLQPFNGFFACHNAMAAHGEATSMESFCASTSQRTLQEPR